MGYFDYCTPELQENASNRVLLDRNARPFNNAYDEADINIDNSVRRIREYDGANKLAVLNTAAKVASGTTYSFPEQWANLRINEAAQKALGLPDAKVHNNIQKYGNTTSATLPLCFHEARLAGKAPEGALVGFAALGAGLHWGAVLLRL